MSVIYDGAQSYMFKKREGKPYQYQSAQRFFSEYT